MEDKITNRMDCIRARFEFLDKPENLPIWKDQAPLKFTEKSGLARSQFAELTGIGGEQSVNTTGNAADKLREEKELEDEAFTIARAYVLCCQDADDETLAAKYDFPITHWRRLRDEALLEKSRLLEADAAKLLEGPLAASATGYGITPAARATLKKEGDDYQKFISAPVTAISKRAALTASLHPKSRAILALFDQMDDLALQFRGTPEGAAFTTAYLATANIIPRGHRYEKEEEPPKPPVP